MTPPTETAPPRVDAAATGMTKRRIVLVSAMMFGVVALHANATVVGYDRWPFCTYPMYAKFKVQGDLVRLRLVGVLADGTETPMLGNEHMRPFDQSRIAESLEKMTLTDDPTGRHAEALKDTLDRYHRRRLMGHHDGPAITRLRLYRTKHELRPWAENLHRPEDRALLAEVAVDP
jgi:hypothetical protein